MPFLEATQELLIIITLMPRSHLCVYCCVVLRYAGYIRSRTQQYAAKFEGSSHTIAYLARR